MNFWSRLLVTSATYTLPRESTHSMCGITNWAAGKSPARLKHEDVTAGVAAVAPALRSVLERLILALA